MLRAMMIHESTQPRRNVAIPITSWSKVESFAQPCRRSAAHDFATVKKLFDV